MNDIELKRLTEADVEDYISLEKSVDGTKIYSAMTDRKEALEDIRKGNTYFIIENGQIVGGVSYELKAPDHAHIGGLAVHPDYQGRGIARAAMLKVLDKLKDTLKIDLVTHPDNERAIKLYESLGFARGETIENYFGDGEPRIVMALEH